VIYVDSQLAYSQWFCRIVAAASSSREGNWRRILGSFAADNGVLITVRHLTCSVTDYPEVFWIESSESSALLEWSNLSLSVKKKPLSEI
jgi:hypothetical protein